MSGPRVDPVRCRWCQTVFLESDGDGHVHVYCECDDAEPWKKRLHASINAAATAWNDWQKRRLP